MMNFFIYMMLMACIMIRSMNIEIFDLCVFIQLSYINDLLNFLP